MRNDHSRPSNSSPTSSMSGRGRRGGVAAMRKLDRLNLFLMPWVSGLMMGFLIDLPSAFMAVMTVLFTGLAFALSGKILDAK